MDLGEVEGSVGVNIIKVCSSLRANTNIILLQVSKSF